MLPASLGRPGAFFRGTQRDGDGIGVRPSLLRGFCGLPLFLLPSAWPPAGEGSGATAIIHPRLPRTLPVSTDCGGGVRRKHSTSTTSMMTHLSSRLPYPEPRGSPHSPVPKLFFGNCCLCEDPAERDSQLVIGPDGEGSVPFYSYHEGHAFPSVTSAASLPHHSSAASDAYYGKQHPNSVPGLDPEKLHAIVGHVANQPGTTMQFKNAILERKDDLGLSSCSASSAVTATPRDDCLLSPDLLPSPVPSSRFHHTLDNGPLSTVMTKSHPYKQPFRPLSPEPSNMSRSSVETKDDPPSSGAVAEKKKYLQQLVKGFVSSAAYGVECSAVDVGTGATREGLYSVDKSITHFALDLFDPPTRLCTVPLRHIDSMKSLDQLHGRTRWVLEQNLSSTEKRQLLVIEFREGEHCVPRCVGLLVPPNPLSVPHVPSSRPLSSSQDRKDDSSDETPSAPSTSSPSTTASGPNSASPGCGVGNLSSNDMTERVEEFRRCLSILRLYSSKNATAQAPSQRPPLEDALLKPLAAHAEE